MSYKRFAEVYDQLMEHAPYDEWVDFTNRIIASVELDVRKIVDLGCGTGKITIPLAKAGYEMIGVDLSEDMLTLAATYANEEKTSVSWLHQDIRNLTGFENVDLFISYCDVINYVTSKQDVYAVFQNVYQSLRPDGIFIFDIHSLKYVNDALINHTFTDVQDDIAYIWDCLPGERDGEMYHELTFFVKDGQQYERFDETHHQQVYRKEDYEKLLKSIGFTKITFFADFDAENELLKNNHERTFIVATK